MKRKLLYLALGAVIVICLAVGVSLLIPEQEELSEELTLSDYPSLFEKEVAIVIGENATQIEIEGAEAIAENVYNSTGTMPVLVSNTELTKNEKAKYNLIIVGNPRTNRMLEEVYTMTNATRVTDEYPGENKGLLEILRNPWNEDKAMLLVEGSDESGVKSGVEMIKNAQNLDLSEIIAPLQGIFCYSASKGPYVLFVTCNKEEYYIGSDLKFLEKVNENEFIPHIPPYVYEPPIQTWDKWVYELNGTIEIVNPKITNGMVRTGYDSSAVKKVDNLITWADKMVQVSLSECVTCWGDE